MRERIIHQVKAMIVPPIVKFTLTDMEGIVSAAGAETDVTNEVGSWKELEVEMERDGTSGVITEVSFPITFHEEAAEVVEGIFNRNEMNGKAVFKVYHRADHSSDYTLVKSLDLDFSTYKKSPSGVEIEGINNTLASYVSSDGRTKYDIHVADVAEAQKWNYRRMPMLTACSWTLPTWDEEPGGEDYYTIKLQIGVSESERTKSIFMSKNDAQVVRGGLPSIFQDQTVQIVRSSGNAYQTDQFFFQARESVDIRKATLKIDLTMGSTSNDVKYALITTGENNAGENNFIVEKEWAPQSPFVGICHIQEEMTLLFLPNTKFALIATPTKSGAPLDYERVWVKECKTFEITYWDQGPAIEMDVIRPEKLAQKLLNVMTGSETYACAIQWKLNGYADMICAAETVRGFKDARIHTSLDDFTEWMRVLGYEYGIDGNVLQFKPRNSMFEKDGPAALELDESEVAGLQVAADAEYAYTSVKIGFDKQDYDSVNGRFEANGTFEYGTDYTARNENTLEMISPYRGDSIGLELLTWTRGEKQTDDSSDNDVFCVALKQTGSGYETYMDDFIFDTEYTKIDEDTKKYIEGPKMFNAPYCPKNLVIYNSSLLGISTKKLKFASTDMSRTARLALAVGHYGEIYDDLILPSRLFKPVAYLFSTGNYLDLPERKNGLVQFEYDGNVYRGYIRKIAKNYAAEKENNWELWAVD